MKRVFFLLMLAAGVSQAQYQMVQWSKLGTNDTAKMAGANWGILSKFVTFPDGSKITTAGITKQRLIDSLNAASPWLTQMTRSWQFDSTIQARQTDFPEIAVPSNPAADKIRLFAVADADFTVLETLTDLGIRNRLNQDVFRIARNTTGSPISAGQVVYFNGSTGNKPNFALAEADLEAAMPAIGVTTATVADNGFGEIMIVGRLTGVKTDYEGWNEGDPLYVSPTTPGGLTDVRPTHPNFTQWIGTVEVVHANAGVILINVQAMLGREDGTNRNSYTIGDQGTGTKSLIFDGLADGTLSWNSATSNWGLTSGYLMLGTDTAATRAYARGIFPNNADTSKYIEDGQATASLGALTADKVYGLKYQTRHSDQDHWIGTLPLAQTWTDPGYADIYASGSGNNQPHIIKYGGVYYIFYETYKTGYVSGVNKWRISLVYSTSLAGPWTLVDSILTHGTATGSPDSCFVADPTVLYIPWAEHPWNMWFDQAADTVVQTTTIGHAYADNPLGPWTKQNTGGVTDVVIARGGTGEYDATTVHAPEAFLYGGVVHLLVNVQGTGHTLFDAELAIATDRQGIGSSFEKWGPVTTDSTVTNGRADRLSNPFVYENVLYTILQTTDSTNYWVSSYDGGKSWNQLGASYLPFHSFIVEDNKIIGLTHKRGGQQDFPMKIYWLDLNTASGTVTLATDTVSNRTNLPYIWNTYYGYNVRNDTKLYRVSAGNWRTPGSLTADGDLVATNSLAVGTSAGSSALAMYIKGLPTKTYLFGMYSPTWGSPVLFADTAGRMSINRNSVSTTANLAIGGAFGGAGRGGYTLVPNLLEGYRAWSTTPTITIDTSGNILAQYLALGTTTVSTALQMYIKGSTKTFFVGMYSPTNGAPAFIIDTCGRTAISKAGISATAYLAVGGANTGGSPGRYTRLLNLIEGYRSGSATATLRIDSSGNIAGGTVTPLGTSGQQGWLVRNATAPQSGTLTAATATDTLQMARILAIGTTEPFRIAYNAANYIPFVATSTGEMYINPTGKGVLFGGTATATAKVHLAAGTAAASTAPLKFTAGVPLTTPEPYVVEPSEDGNYLLFTRGSGVRDTLKTGGASGTRLDSAGGWYRTGLIKTDEAGVKVMIRGTAGDTTSTSLLHVGGTMDVASTAEFLATKTYFGTASSITGQVVLRHASNASTTIIKPSDGDGAVTLTTPNETGTIAVLAPAATQTFGANNVWNGGVIDTAYLQTTKYHNQAQWTVTGLPDSLSAKLNRSDTTSLLVNRWRLGGYYATGDTAAILASKSFVSNQYTSRPVFVADTIYKAAQIATKQNTIVNLADTSKYVEGLDSLKAAGYATRTMLQADSLYRKAQDLIRMLYSDTTSTVANQWRLGYKIGVVGYSVGDTSSFTTTATRKAIYVSGARDNQVWAAAPRIAANTLLPVAGDWVTISSKWDSVIVKRPVGTTSGLKFNYWRVR